MSAINIDIATTVAEYVANDAEYRRLDGLPLTPEIDAQLDSLAANSWLLRARLTELEAHTLEEYRAKAKVLMNDRGAVPADPLAELFHGLFAAA